MGYNVHVLPLNGWDKQISRVVGGEENVAIAAFGIARYEHVHAGRDTREAG